MKKYIVMALVILLLGSVLVAIEGSGRNPTATQIPNSIESSNKWTPTARQQGVAILSIGASQNQGRPLGVILFGHLKDQAGNGINGKNIYLYESTVGFNGPWYSATGTAAGNPTTTGTSVAGDTGYYRFDKDVPNPGRYYYKAVFYGDNQYTKSEAGISPLIGVGGG